MLYEMLVAMTVLSLFFAFSVRYSPPAPAVHSQESAVVFLGMLLGEMRISQETMGTHQVRVHEQLLVASQGGRTRYRVELDPGVTLMLPEGGGLRFQTGANYNYTVNDQNGRSGLLYVGRGGTVECKIMMNFGTFVFDLR